MVHQVKYNGRIHRFPDEATPEMMSEALGLNKSSSIQKNEEKNKNIFSGFDKKGIEEFQKHTKQLSSGILPGIKEGFLESINAIRGKPYESNYKPKEEWESGGKSIGKFLGSVPAFGAIAAPIAATGGAAGFPVLGAMLGGGIAGGLTTPGNKESRLSGAAIGSLPIGAAHIIPKIFKSLKNIGKNAFKNVKPYEESAEKAAVQHGNVLEEAEKAALEAQTETGKKSQGALQYAKGRTQKELEEIPKEELIHKPEEIKHNLEYQKSELKNTENKISNYLNKDADHGIRIANSIKNRVKSIEDYWSDSYKKFLGKIKDNKFEIPEEAIKEIKYDPKNIDMNEVLKRIKNGSNPRTVIKEMEEEHNEKFKNEYFDHLLSKAPKVNDTDASIFLSKYKDFRDTLGQLKSDMRSENIGAIEKNKIKDAIESGEEMMGQIKETLNKGLGEHKNEFDWLNEGYSKYVFPLRNNPIVNKAKEGKLSSNVLKDMRTNEEGMDIVRDIVKNDPELLRNVVGQRFAKEPHKLHEIGELEREYVEKMPELTDMLSSHGERSLKIEKMENNIPKIEQAAKNLEKRKELEEKIELYDKHIKNLEEKSKRKNISLSEKVRTEKKLKEIQLEKQKAKNKLKKAAYGVAGVIGIPYGYKKISNLFTE